MAVIEIPVGELGTTRVFSLSMNDTEAQHLRDDTDEQTKRFGAAPQNAQGIEIFPISDLEGIGLAGFLRDGIDAYVEDIDRDRIKLAALEGWVLLVHSSAFAQMGARLSPDSALTLIGTYAQRPADNAPVKLEAEAAKPYTGTAPSGPPEVTRSRTRAGWVVVIIIAVSLPFLVWAFV